MKSYFNAHKKPHIQKERYFWLHMWLFNLLDKQWLGKYHTICDSFKIGSDSNLMNQERGVGERKRF